MPPERWTDLGFFFSAVQVPLLYTILNQGQQHKYRIIIMQISNYNRVHMSSIHIKSTYNSSLIQWDDNDDKQMAIDVFTNLVWWNATIFGWRKQFLYCSSSILAV